MRKRQWNSSLFVYPLAALCALIAGILLYLFPWISRNEAALNDRAFRSLASVSDQLSERLASLADVLKQVERVSDGNKYLAAQAPNLQYDVKCDPKRTSPLSVVREQAGGFFRIADDKHCLLAAMKDTVEPIFAAITDGVFDDVFISDEQGLVIFQTQRTGIRVDNLSVLIPEGMQSRDKESSSKQEGKTQETGHEKTEPRDSVFLHAVEASTLFPVTIAGTEYQLYLVPVASSGELTSGERVSHLVTAGLLRTSELRQRAQIPSPLAVVWFVGVVLIILFGSWPLLKFTTMRQTEHVPRWSGVLCLFTTVVTVCLLMLLVLHYGYQKTTDDREGRFLAALARTIDDHVRGELVAALKALDEAERSPPFKGSVIPAANDAFVERSNLLNTDRYLFATYPYLDQFFWLDSNGIQRIKWTVREVVTPQVVSNQYNYFKEIRVNNLWSVEDHGHWWRFRVEPLYSPNTGQYLTVIARPVPRTASQTQLRVAAAVAPLASLIDPILPPDYGFAIVDNSGTVLFHSSSSRNLRENFFLECDKPDQVRAAVLTQGRNFINGLKYHGSPNVLMVAPLTSIVDCPWSLIVFHDLEATTARHIERIILFGLQVACLILILMLAGAIVIAMLPQYPWEWAWPTHGRRGVYAQIAISYFVFCAAALLWFQQEPLGGIFGGCVLLSLGSFGVAAVKLKRGETPFWIITALFLGAAAWQPSQAVPLLLAALAAALMASPAILNLLERIVEKTAFPLEHSYASAVTWVIVAASVIPCIGFFKVATDYENFQFVKRNQLLTYRDLEHRAASVVNRYRPIHIGTTTDSQTFDPLRSLFFRRRLLEANWDRYDGTSTTLLEHPANNEEASIQFFDQTATVLSWLPNDGAVLMRSIARGDLKQAGWSWSFETPTRLRFTRHQSHNAGIGYFSSESAGFVQDALVSDFERLNQLNLRSSIGIFLLVVGLFLWLHITLHWLFAMGTQELPPWDSIDLTQLGNQTQNLIVLGFPCSGKSKRLRALDGVAVWDMAEMIEGKHNPALRMGVITVLDNFDYRMEDPEVNRRKLALLEHLKRRGAGPIAIVTAIHPLYYFDPRSRFDTASETEEFGSVFEQWTRALVAFKTVTAYLPFPERKTTYYDVLWFTCSPVERAALNQLARYGWPNHKNRHALEHLKRRELVVRDPAWRIADEGFARYLSERVSENVVREWEREEGAKGWDGIKFVLILVGVAVLALVLFIIQQDRLALLTGALSTAASLGKSISELRGRGRPAAGGMRA